MKSNIIMFLSGTGTDNKGRYLRELQLKNYMFFKHSQDYIQWMFPLNVGNIFNTNTPVLTDQDIYDIQNDLLIQTHILRSLDVMLNFYGFERKETEIKKNNLYFLKKSNWLTHDECNCSQITRILKCLRLADLGIYADSFLKELLEVAGNNVSEKTLNDWISTKHI